VHICTRKKKNPLKFHLFSNHNFRYIFDQIKGTVCWVWCLSLMESHNYFINALILYLKIGYPRVLAKRWYLCSLTMCEQCNLILTNTWIQNTGKSIVERTFLKLYPLTVYLFILCYVAGAHELFRGAEVEAGALSAAEAAATPPPGLVAVPMVKS